MNVAGFIRVIAAATVLSTLSFAAGVAGDLSLADPPNYGERVVLRLPPALPADAVRARPLPLLSTALAEAQPAFSRQWTPLRTRTIDMELLAAPEGELVLAALPKEQSVLFGKPQHRRQDI